MDSIQFTAHRYYNDVEDHVLMVGLYGDRRFLSVQLTLPPASDNLPAELQTYLVERDDPGFATRNGIREIILKPNQLLVRLNDLGRKELQCEGIRVDLDLDPITWLELKIALLRVFKNQMSIVS